MLATRGLPNPWELLRDRCPFPLELPLRRDTHDGLARRSVEVDGRRTAYLVGGEGLPVLFLHGWGLGPRAYSAVLQRLVAIGCRVYAPALPGFGGSADLPRARRTLPGYGAWAASFLRAVGVGDPVFALGHSFGGGVAIQLTYDHPEQVSYLVLMNSVGGAGMADEPLAVHLVDSRPPWRWAQDLTRELLPSRSGLAMMRAMRDELSSNVLLNPLAMWEIGLLARRADLSAELAALGRGDIPVLALWSDDDHVFPSTSFDALCSAIGTDGRVISGRHSWLLADADAFGEILGNIVEVQVAEHGARTAMTTAAEILSLLAGTSVPRRVAGRLVADANPLWLLSEPPAVLAGDLALCHPRLARHEVRAVARPVEGSRSIRLTVVATDRPGLLADTTSLLATEGLSVTAASAVTWTSRRIALHALTLEGGAELDEQRWELLGHRLRDIAGGDRPELIFRPAGRATVTTSPQGTGRAIVTVVAPDQRGLLAAICRWLAEHGASIEAARARTWRGTAEDHFVIAGTCDAEALASALATGEVRAARPLADGALG